jgi:hypothetical protein
MSEWIGDEYDPQAISFDTPTSFSPPCTLDGKLAKNQPAASTRQACRKNTQLCRKLTIGSGKRRCCQNEFWIYAKSPLRPRTAETRPKPSPFRCLHHRAIHLQRRNERRRRPIQFKCRGVHPASPKLYAGSVVRRPSSTGPPTVKW